MQPYWVTFESLREHSSLGFGVGVTGHDRGDVLKLVEEAFGPMQIRSMAVVHDVATLDQGHVRPNMGSIFLRGVWFPLGHQQVGSPEVR